MFNVYTVTPGTDKPGQFFLRAPLATLGAIWALHESALSRINKEAMTKTPCMLFDNNRGKFPTPQLAVFRDTTPVILTPDEATLVGALLLAYQQDQRVTNMVDVMLSEQGMEADAVDTASVLLDKINDFRA